MTRPWCHARHSSRRLVSVLLSVGPLLHPVAELLPALQALRRYQQTSATCSDAQQLASCIRLCFSLPPLPLPPLPPPAPPPTSSEHASLDGGRASSDGESGHSGGRHSGGSCGGSRRSSGGSAPGSPLAMTPGQLMSLLEICGSLGVGSDEAWLHRHFEVTVGGVQRSAAAVTDLAVSVSQAFPTLPHTSPAASLITHRPPATAANHNSAQSRALVQGPSVQGNAQPTPRVHCSSGLRQVWLEPQPSWRSGVLHHVCTSKMESLTVPAFQAWNPDHDPQLGSCHIWSHRLDA